MRTVLYITYDGLTDSLGQSQILAYLKKLSTPNNQLIIVSFEKRAAYRTLAHEIKKVVDEHGLKWIPVKYTKKPPILSTIWDLTKAHRVCSKVYVKYHPEIVHCRGYIAAIVGTKLKGKHGLKFIFDMRGWWADEKLESGFWNHPIFKPIYRYFKRMEKIFFSQCDFAVSLTYRGKAEIERQGLAAGNKIGVIPTCVDFGIFKARDDLARAMMRQKLGLDVNDKVFVYSGSLGGNYEVQILIGAFKAFKKNYPQSYLLILSKENFDDQILQKFRVEGMDRVAVYNAPFLEVTNYLQAGDVGFIYYRPTFSTIGRSPTKLAEYWASGIPVIAFRGIGDLDYIFNRYPDGGVLLSDDESEWETEMRALQFSSYDILREHAKEYFDVERGVQFYHSIYEKLLPEKEKYEQP
jgi:glycosyltransferase involved in cell wall biosynthesis